MVRADRAAMNVGAVILSKAKIFPTVILSGVGAGREAKDLKLRRYWKDPTRFFAS